MKWSPDAIEGEVLEKIRTRLSHPYGDDTVKLKITIGFGTPELFREAEEWNNCLVFYQMLHHTSRMKRWGENAYVPPVVVKAISQFLILDINRISDIAWF